MAHVLAFANQKGGVGKTTTVVTVGAAMAELGLRVAVVDLDAQACATFSLGIDPEDVEVSTREVLIDKVAIDQAVIRTADGVDLVPSTIRLADADSALSGAKGREFAVRQALEPLKARYDWILLDCAPSLGIVTVGALIAAQSVAIPLQCETLSHRGVGQLLETIDDVRTYANASLRIAGIIPTQFDARTTHARAVLADLPATYGVQVLPPIRRSIRFAEAPAAGRTVLSTAPTSVGARDYRALAQALVSQLG
ncbi:MAG: AAA family ATPase [Candidatus Nanopelagicales bacterium]|nr:AAA family ATPase [Candidatus Nanopelagicales bacterium]